MTSSLHNFQDGHKWGVSIQYLEEDKPLGTAGSLALLPKALNNPFLVLNGDVLTQFDPSQLLNFHNDHNAHATLCVTEHILNIPFGVVKTDGYNLLSFEEKPSYQHLVNAGVYIVDPQLLSLLNSGEFMDMPTFLMLAQETGMNVAVCPIHEYWLDIGRPETLLKAHQEWPISDTI